MAGKRESTAGLVVTERALLDYLNSPDYRPAVQRELLHRMHVTNAQRPAARRMLRRLLEEGRVRKTRGGRLVAAPPVETFPGIVHRHRDGYGFVMREGGGEDVFVPAPDLGDAMSGDRVAVQIAGRSRDGRVYGAIDRVLAQRPNVLLGVFRSQGTAGVVQPFESAAEPFPLLAGSAMAARDLDVVRVELVRRPGRPVAGRVLEVLGSLDDPGIDVRIVAEKHGLALTFPAAVLEQARRLPSSIGRADATGRERFDEPAPVTIDGETAADFDDAIAVSELADGGFRLFVHIADVAHFVGEGTALDEEARRRGTSVYFPNRVIPMFPEELSNHLCSLRPLEDRLVQSAILDFDAAGAPRSVRFADGCIRSAARLTYTQVAATLAGEGAAEGVPPEVVPMLRSADRLRELLERRRRARGSIDFDLPEPQLLLDVEGVMTGITLSPRNQAHRMIEEFMLAANEAVALELEHASSACVYRIHERPDALKLQALAEFVRHFDLELAATPETVRPADIQRMLEQAEQRPEFRVISQVTLRSMKQARYSTANIGHFGLASPTYCHFTSPIRRYPDLLVHRLLRAKRRGKPLTASEGEDQLEPVAVRCSELERTAEGAERELLLRKKVAFIAGAIGEEFDAIVTGVARFGLFVQLTENLVEGLLRVERLGEERFEFIESRFALRGERSGRTFTLGDQLRVRVERVDRVLLRVDLGLVQAGERPRRPSLPGPARRSSGGKAGRRAKGVR